MKVVKELEDGAEDPDGGQGDHDQQERKAEDVAHSLLLRAGGCFGLVEMNSSPCRSIEASLAA